MRIGYLIPQFPEQTHAFFWREHLRLAKLGIECEFISTRSPQMVNRARHAWIDQAIEQTTYLHRSGPISLLKCCLDLLRVPPKHLFKCLGALRRSEASSPADYAKLIVTMLYAARLRKIALSRDLKHIHVHSCANALNVAMFCRLLGGPTYSMTLHGFLKDYGPNQPQKWRHADFAIVITEQIRELVTKSLNSDDLPALHVAGMGIEPEAFSRSTPYVPARRSEPVRLFTCSRLNPCKRIEDLIQAVSIIRERGLDVSLNIAGEDERVGTPIRNQLESLIESHDLNDHVSLLGSIAESAVRDQLNQAHIFALVSLEEPLGVATMEAMAMQVPVIITQSGGAVELVHDKVHGLHVQPRQPEQIADAIEWLVNHPEEALAMGQRGRERVENHYHSGISAQVIAQEVRRLHPATP